MTGLDHGGPVSVLGMTRSASWRCDPDIALMLRVQGDDTEAFAQLVTRYRTRIFGRFVRLLGDRQEAEDLTQEVFLRLYRHRKRYQPRARLATWLYHISRNLGANALRARQARHAIVSGLLDRDRIRAIPGVDGRPPSLNLERSEAAMVVRVAVGGLARRQRAAIELHQFQDCSYAEVAEELAMTPKAAKSLLYRARIQLRAALAPYLAQSLT